MIHTVNDARPSTYPQPSSTCSRLFRTSSGVEVSPEYQPFTMTTAIRGKDNRHRGHFDFYKREGAIEIKTS
jgi:hypothetical protein